MPTNMYDGRHGSIGTFSLTHPRPAPVPLPNSTYMAGPRAQAGLGWKEAGVGAPSLKYGKRERQTCFPLRYKLLTTASIQLLIAIGFVGIVVYIAIKLESIVTDLQRLGMYIHGFVYACLVFFSLFGMIAAVLQSRKLVSIYFGMIIGQIVLSMGSAALSLALFLGPTPHVASSPTGDLGSPLKCASVKPALDDFSKAFCERRDYMQGVVVIGFALVWAFEIYGLFVSTYYSHELLDDMDDEESIIDKYPRY